MSLFRAVLPVLLLPILAVPTSATAAADDLCFGQAPTIVGTPSENVTGTDGPDVIVATDAVTIRGLGGDDRICVIGDLSRKLLAGPGDDHVETLRADGIVRVRLGSGSDTFVGGSTYDYVDAGDADDAVAGLPLGVDDISTGRGQDLVVTGAGTDVDALNADVIALGGDGDQVRVRGSFVPSIDGGRSEDEVSLRSSGGGDWSIDAVTGEVDRDGLAMGPVTHVTRYNLAGLQWDHLEFTGGDDDEELTLGRGSARVGPDGPIAVDMGGGNDTVLEARSQDVGSLDGGDGFDSLSINAVGTTSRRTSLLLDLGRSLLRLTGGAKLSVQGWGRIYVDQADRSRFVGDGLANQLIVFGCDNTIRGGGGNDQLTAYPGDGGCTKFARAARGVDINGGPGNDHIYGTYFHDVLVGGPGRDTIRGANGGDRCDAEVEKDCGR